MPAHPEWTPHVVDIEPPEPQQLPLGFVDLSDRITTSEVARMLGMSSENVRVLARVGVLACYRVGAGTRLFSRRQVEAVHNERLAQSAFTRQPMRRLRMPYAAYRSGTR